MREIVTSRVGEEIAYRGVKLVARKTAAYVSERIDQAWSWDIHANNPAYYKEGGKRLGIVEVIYCGWPYNTIDTNQGLLLREGTPVILVSLPPVKQEDRSLAKATDSLRMVAEYIELQELRPRYILGITYERLALASRRNGFIPSSQPVHPEIHEVVKKEYAHFKRQGLVKGPMGKSVLVFQRTRDFMQRFGTTARVR